MIIKLKGADFSANNINTLLTNWFISVSLGSGADSSNTTTSVAKGAAYNNIITIADGYELGSAGVTVTMGGTAITPTISGNTITISIASVTGNVIIKVPTVNTSTGEESGGGATTTTYVYANQNLIGGYIDSKAVVSSPEGKHKHFTIPAEGIDTITITPPMAGAVNTLYYLIHKADDGTVTTYFNIKDGVTPGVAQTITLGGNATGTLYFNAFKDEADGSYTYVKEAIVTTVGNDNSEGSGSTDGEVYVFANAANRTLGFIAASGSVSQSNSHYYSSIPAAGVQSISVTPTMAGAVDSLYYIIHKADNGTVTPYVHLKESIGVTKTINFGGTATGTIYFNEFVDNNNYGYEYVTQAIIKR